MPHTTKIISCRSKGELAVSVNGIWNIFVTEFPKHKHKSLILRLNKIMLVVSENPNLTKAMTFITFVTTPEMEKMVQRPRETKFKNIFCTESLINMSPPGTAMLAETVTAELKWPSVKLLDIVKDKACLAESQNENYKIALCNNVMSSTAFVLW